jgi:hypothetical protein
MQDLKPNVVYPSLHHYPMGKDVEAMPLWAVLPESFA